MEDNLKKIKIIVSGQAEAGKDIVLNGLVGYEFLKRSHVSEKKVTTHQWKDNDNNFEVIVCDILSLGDFTKNDQQDIKANSADANLFLYCISVYPTGVVLETDKKALKELKDGLSPSLWNRCIIALTFANVIAKRSEDRNQNSLTWRRRKVSTDYHDGIEKWITKIKGVLEELKIPNRNEISILPAGTAASFSILKDEKYWLSDLYQKAIDISEEEQKSVLVLINAHRLIANTLVKTEDFDKEIINQPLVVTDNSTDVNKILQQLTAAVSVGGVTGAVGATIGATVGALAIGLPTFGVAAGVGMLLGSAVGGGIGVGVGIGASKVSSHYQQKKHTLDKGVDMVMWGGLMGQYCK